MNTKKLHPEKGPSIIGGTTLVDIIKYPLKFYITVEIRCNLLHKNISYRTPRWVQNDLLKILHQ